MNDGRQYNRHVANPGDPAVKLPTRGPHGELLPGPNYLGLEGRNAIVQGQVALVVIIFVAQLLLVTTALYDLLSGHSDTLGWLALCSGAGFVLAFIIVVWPRHRIERP